jgi:hypothetical protein
MMHSSVYPIHIWCVTMEQPTINPPEKIQAIAQDFQQPQFEDQTLKNDGLSRKQNKWQLIVDIINRIGAVVMELFHPRDDLDRFRRCVKAFGEEARWKSFNR